MPKPENKKILAVDIDDVIYPFVPSLIDYLDSNHKVKMSHEDFVEYDIRKVWGGGPEEAEEIFQKYIKDSGIEIAPIKGAQQAIRKLAENYEIVIMTSRSSKNFPKTEAWLTQHFPDIFREVHLLGNKYDDDRYRRKAEVCKELGVHCLIDDHLPHVLETNEVGIKTLLFGDYPWNQIHELPEEITRVHSWREVLEYFDEHDKSKF